jgi:hypothetical protein
VSQPQGEYGSSDEGRRSRLSAPPSWHSRYPCMSRTPRRDIHENADFRSQFPERLAKLTILPTPVYAISTALGRRSARRGSCSPRTATGLDARAATSPAPGRRGPPSPRSETRPS